MKTKNNLAVSAQGFSLVELLVVIAVIAIIAAIAIPNIANITSNASYAKNQRNAQNIASTAAAARAAGYTGTWADVTAAVTELTANGGQGIPYTNAGGNVMNFGVSGLSATDVTEAAAFLTLSTTTPPTLLYSQTTNASTN